VNYLYFVSEDDRRHRFSSTLVDHNAAVTRYRRFKSR
jgi:cell division protein YceG involved in septum cleavage